MVALAEVRTDNLNVAATALENGSKVVAAFTVAKSAFEIIRHHSPLLTILKGAVLATGLLALSVVCDSSVDWMRGPDLS